MSTRVNNYHLQCYRIQREKKIGKRIRIKCRYDVIVVALMTENRGTQRQTAVSKLSSICFRFGVDFPPKWTMNKTTRSQMYRIDGLYVASRGNCLGNEYVAMYFAGAQNCSQNIVVVVSSFFYFVVFATDRWYECAMKWQNFRFENRRPVDFACCRSSGQTTTKPQKYGMKKKRTKKRIVLFINVPVSGALIIYSHRFAINLMWSRKNVQLSRLSRALINGWWHKPLVHLHRKGVNCMLWMAVSRLISKESINWHIIRIRSTLNAQRVQWFFFNCICDCAYVCVLAFFFISCESPSFIFTLKMQRNIYIGKWIYDIWSVFFSELLLVSCCYYWCYYVYVFFSWISH